jgi:hypothetical protein
LHERIARDLAEADGRFLDADLAVLPFPLNPLPRRALDHPSTEAIHETIA